MKRVVGTIALVIALVLAVAATGRGEGDDLGSGDLVWQKRPHVYRNAALPDDRVLRGVVRNDSLEVMKLSARDLVVRDGKGDELESAVIFAPTFIRGVFPQNRGDEIPESERLRIGLLARIEPGRTVPITVSWRELGKRAALVDYGTGSLPLAKR